MLSLVAAGEHWGAAQMIHGVLISAKKQTLRPQSSPRDPCRQHLHRSSTLTFQRMSQSIFAFEPTEWLHPLAGSPFLHTDPRLLLHHSSNFAIVQGNKGGGLRVLET